MSFSRVKPLGWAPLEKLTATQMNDLDTNVSKAVDGDAGGSYSPSSQIQIANAGLGVSGPLDVSGAISSSGTNEFTGTTTFKGDGDDNLPLLAKAATADPRRYQHRQLIGAAEGESAWTFLLGGGLNIKWVQEDTSSAFKLQIPFNWLPARGTIITVSAYVNGGGAGGHSGLPATLPQMTLYSSSADDGGLTNEGFNFDGSDNLTEYEVTHSIQITNLSLPVAPGTVYYLELEGETGTDSKDSALSLRSVSVVVDVDKIGP